MRNNDPNHPFVIIFAPRSRDRLMLAHPPDPPSLRRYRAVADAFGVDVYPIYHRGYGFREPKLHMVGMWTRAMRRAIGSPSIMTSLQICFAGSDDRFGSGRFVLPTRRQERYMIYDAIVNGARGLTFFAAGSSRTATRARTPPGAGTGSSGAASSAPSSARSDPEAAARGPAPPGDDEAARDRFVRHAGDQPPGGTTLWVIATQRGPSGATVTVRGLPAWARVGRRYPAGPPVIARGGRIRAHLDGWQVLVLRFTQPAS